MPDDLEVSAAGLVRGGQLCSDAGDSAARGASRLNSASLPKDMFGAFSEAHGFHQTLTGVHDSHQEQLHGHRATLADVGTKAHAAGSRFTQTDQSESARLQRAADRIGN